MLRARIASACTDSTIRAGHIPMTAAALLQAPPGRASGTIGPTASTVDAR